jgi:hypothetical protein
MVVLAAVWCSLLACSEQFSGPEDALGDTAERVEQVILPPIVADTEAMLRNYLNMLPVLLEICATPVGELGDFTSQLPELQRAQQQVGDTFTVDDENGFWQVAWRDVIFGDQDGRLTSDVDALGIDVMLTARFRNTGLGSVRAVPFDLPSAELLQTSREPGGLHTCTETTPEGFYLFQDRLTGLWTLGWCAQGTSKVFEGQITAASLSRVSRKVSSETTEEVSSLTVNSSATTLQFEETAEPMVTEGIRFFARPGDSIDFELRIGPAGGSTSGITQEQLRLGVSDAEHEQFLPSGFNPADFKLSTAVPIVPTGKPDVTVRRDFATFIWQDDVPGPCTEAGEILWHLRFHAARGVLFSGYVASSDDDAPNPRLRVLRSGLCQEGLFEFEDNNSRLNYECVVDDAGENGYDVCVSGAQRVQFSPEVEKVRDPTRVWIGSGNYRPPAQDPYTMLFDVEMEERQSARHLEVTDSRVALLSTTEEANEVPLRENQVSLEVLCHPLDNDPVHVRLIGEGEFSTEQFEGSRYEFEELEFTDGLRTFDVSAQRLPDRGELELDTQDVEDTAEIIAPTSRFTDANGRVTSTVDITLTLDTLRIDYVDRLINLSLGN